MKDSNDVSHFLGLICKRKDINEIIIRGISFKERLEFVLNTFDSSYILDMTFLRFFTLYKEKDCLASINLKGLSMKEWLRQVLTEYNRYEIKCDCID